MWVHTITWNSITVLAQNVCNIRERACRREARSRRLRTLARQIERDNRALRATHCPISGNIRLIKNISDVIPRCPGARNYRVLKRPSVKVPESTEVC